MIENQPIKLWIVGLFAKSLENVFVTQTTPFLMQDITETYKPLVLWCCHLVETCKLKKFLILIFFQEPKI